MDFREKPAREPTEGYLTVVCTTVQGPSGEPMGFIWASGYSGSYSGMSLKRASKLESIAQHLGSDVEAYVRLQLSQSCLPFRIFCVSFRVFSSGVFVFEVRVVVPFRPLEFLSSLWMGKCALQFDPSK